MGAFMIYHYPRDCRPSDSYLATHSLDCDVYDPDVLEDEDYNYEDDYEIMTMDRTCHVCGRHYTLDEALYDYMVILSQTCDDFLPYEEICFGDYCGACAAEEYENNN